MINIWPALIGALSGFLGTTLIHLLRRKKVNAESESILVKTALELIKEVNQLKQDFERRLNEAEAKIKELEEENRQLHKQLQQLLK